MIGWLVAWKCLVAYLFFESSQQPTCPQVRQRRRCTQVSPVFRQSSHPLALGVTSCIWSRWLHCFVICSCFPSLFSNGGGCGFTRIWRVCACYCSEAPTSFSGTRPPA